MVKRTNNDETVFSDIMAKEMKDGREDRLVEIKYRSPIDGAVAATKKTGRTVKRVAGNASHKAKKIVKKRQADADAREAKRATVR